MKRFALLSTIACLICSCAGSGESGTSDVCEYVDLGLPSGLMWATCNVGASSPEEYGDYYDWGDLRPESKDYPGKHCDYEGVISGMKEYDIARNKWGGSWRMPTEVEFRELYYNCSVEWTTHNGRQGCKFTGPNGNSIFLPAAGICAHGAISRNEESCDYWTGSPGAWPWNASKFQYVDKNIYAQGPSEISKIVAQPIRPVCEDLNAPSNLARKRINGHEYIDLGLPSKLKWATCDIGAPTPGESGNYYMWGDLSAKGEYDYEHNPPYDKSIRNISGNPDFDPATNEWGATWRTPTKEEFEELIRCCVWESKMYGYKITGPNGNYIQLGLYDSLHDRYWTATHRGQYGEAYCLYYESGWHTIPAELGIKSVRSDNKYRIRPVSD